MGFVCFRICMQFYWVKKGLLLFSFMWALWKERDQSFLSGFITVVESLIMILFWWSVMEVKTQTCELCKNWKFWIIVCCCCLWAWGREWEGANGFNFLLKLEWEEWLGLHAFLVGGKIEWKIESQEGEEFQILRLINLGSRLKVLIV
jgi:hypothetical protein